MYLLIFMKFTEYLFNKISVSRHFYQAAGCWSFEQEKKEKFDNPLLDSSLNHSFPFYKKNCCYFIMHFEPATFILNFFLLLAQFKKIRLIDPKIDIIYLVKRLWNYPVRTSIRPRILFQRKMHNKVLLLVHYRFCKIKRV